MALTLYNTLSRSKEEFKPLDGNLVRLYACGPTVYDFSHIGNFRAFLTVDLLKRFLLLTGYDVKQVINITDVDDRIIERCEQERISLEELTQKYRQAFTEDCRMLNMFSADHYPLATDHIGEMQKLIEALLEKGYAYETEDGSVFFKISSFSDYGKLSRLAVSGLSSTDRVLSDTYEKENARDFALWKGRKEEDKDVFWDSSWGRGRPGWHIECSAMSMKYLGEQFDIHCGGVDLIFPHHENEIAQSVCATEKQFVRFWIHCEHLLVDGTKMSKSLGNYYTLRDLLVKGISPMTIRYLLTTTHYRQKIDLTFNRLEAAANSVERLQDFRRRLESVAGHERSHVGNESLPVVKRFTDVMNDDLNISKGVAVIFQWIKAMNRRLDEQRVDAQEASRALEGLRRFDSVIGVVFVDEVELSDEDRALIGEREKAREQENWRRADEIRAYFLEKEIWLEDTSHGTVVKRLEKMKKT